MHAFDFHSFLDELCVVGECVEVVEERTHSTIKEKLFAIERLRKKLQDPPRGFFDRLDLQWDERTNCGQGQRRQTFVAFIPWNCFYDFVNGESSTCDFPCTFLEVPVKVEKGVVCQVGKTSYM